MRGTIASLARLAIIPPLGLLCIASALNRAAPSSPSASQALAHLGFGDAALADQALRALQRPDLRVADSLSRQSVSSAPLRQQNLGILGATRQAQGDAKGAQAAFLAAGQFGWRDTLTQYYWFDWALDAGDLNQASMRADALLRTGRPARPILNMLSLIEEYPEGQAAMAARLANNPPWGDVYVKGLAALGSDAALADRASILRRARVAGFRPDCKAVGETASGLVVRNMLDAAADLWFTTCQPGQDARTGIVDGGFDQTQTAGAAPFGWQLIVNGAVDVRVIDAPPPATGNALYAESTSSLNEPVARQFVLLRPGSYALSWSATGGGDASGQVTMACLPSRASLPQSKRKVTGNGRVVTEFSVPRDGCGGQWITIVVEAKSGADRASLYFDNFKIEPIRAQGISPPPSVTTH